MEEKDDTRYVENSSFRSPYFQNGVSNLGDLWNCRRSEAVGHNLFKVKCIPTEKLRITPIKICDYTLTHVKNELETAKSLNIEGHLSLEFLMNTIKLDGNMKYKDDSSDKINTEVISCRYLNEAYRIDVIPPVGSLINDHVLQLIDSGEIEATHVVGGMIVGSSVTALIEISKKELKKEIEISGKIGGGIAKDVFKLIGNFSGEIKAEWEKKEKSEEFDTKIHFNARPMPSDLPPPSSATKLFEFIEKMPSAMSMEPPFYLDTGSIEIRGVPVQFILYPITQFVKIKIHKLYKSLEDDVMNKFQVVLSKAIQIQECGYVKKLILMRDKELIFLLEKKSVFSDKVKTLEDDLKQIGERFVTLIREQLREYKYGKCGTEEFDKILKDFDSSEAGLIEIKIQELADEGTLEILEAKGTDESYIKRFTVDWDLQNWIKKESNKKIILEIGIQYSKTAIINFHLLTASLSDIGIKMALVMPSIAKEVKLCLMFENTEIVFKDSEVHQALEILCANFGIGNQTRAAFFTVLSAVKGIEYPIHKVSSDLGITVKAMISLVKEFIHFKFVDSVNGFQCLLSELQSDHVAFCLPIDAPETALDIFQTWKNFNIENVTWIILSFGLEEEQELPLLLVMSRDKILAVCLDRLDLLILEKIIEEAAGNISGICFDLFSVDQLRTSFYKLRVSSAFRILSRVAPNVIRAADGILDKTETTSEITEFISIVRSCLKLNKFVILSAIAKLAVCDFPNLTSMLKKYGWNESCKQFTEERLVSDSCREVIAEIEKWLEDDTLKREIDKAELILLNTDSVPNEKWLAIYGIIKHSHCPVGFKTQLEKQTKTQSCEQLRQIFTKLEKCDKSTKSHFSFLHIRNFLKALTFVSSSEDKSTDALIQNVINEYYTIIKSDSPDEAIERHIKNKHFYLLLQQVSPYKYDTWTSTLFKGLKDLQLLEDFDIMPRLVQDLSEICTDEDFIRQIWTNEKWLILIRRCLNVKQGTDTSLLRALLKWTKNVEVKSIMPDDIQQELHSLEVVEQLHFSSVNHVKSVLEKLIYESDDVPWYFCMQLEKALSENTMLESDLIQIGAAIHWDPDDKMFTTKWSRQDMEQALCKLKESYEPKTTDSADTTEIDFKLDLATSLTANEPISNAICPVCVCPALSSVMGFDFNKISDKDYLMVKSIIDFECAPELSQLPSLLPYFLQQIKLWDGNVLKASRISKLSNVHVEEDEESYSDDPTSYETMLETDKDETVEMKQPLSRLDCLAYILNTGDCTVSQEILGVLSKFPLAMSLIIPDIKEENKFIVTLPLLKNIVIRWETSLKVQETKQEDAAKRAETSRLVENHLFSSPFRLVVAVRIGTHHIGKSQILNQVMSHSYYFSSRAEADEKCGPPCTLTGTVEFTWLTEETCIYELWIDLLESHYANGGDEIVLLANLHENANDFPATVNYLKELASCFVVFLMPGWNQNESKILKTLLSDCPMQFIRVDNGKPQISTSRLNHKCTKSQITNLLKSALKQKTNLKNLDKFIVDAEGPLTYSESISTTLSKETTKLINEYSCLEIRKSMADFMLKGFNEWSINDNLQKLTNSILRIFNNSTILDLKKAMTHLETELSKKSAKESIKPRRQVIEVHRQLQIEKFKGKSEDEHRNDPRAQLLNSQMMESVDSVNDSNLGLEHFFRVFGEIYRISLGRCNKETKDIDNLPKYYADLLLNGHSLEILNGDTGEIPLDWLRAICQQVQKRQPHLRVFVISVIGVQSSGKSTLLNALFSCRFAVSVGRCSRGLYMRMVFLEEHLRGKGGYDAIILIDTEGLASSEKMNQSDAERKDRMLATFAMGLSNLTIVNVLGEDLTKITEILQIVIVTMTRLRQADVKPDMLVVQHLQERNELKLNEAKCQFINAIKMAFDLVDKWDVDLGATQNACLAELVRGIDSPDMFYQFSSFKNGSSAHAPPSESYHKDVTRLYRNLIERAEDSPSKLPFERWFQLVEAYWNSVSNEKFALNFKNAKKISEFLNNAKKVATIKEFVGKSFEFHRQEISRQIRVCVNQYLSQKKKKEGEVEELRKTITQDAVFQLRHVPRQCTCEQCKHPNQQIEELLRDVKETEWLKDIDESIRKCIESKLNNELKIFNQMFDVLLLNHNVSTGTVRLIHSEIKRESEKYYKDAHSDKNTDDSAFKNYSEEEKAEIIDRIWDSAKKSTRAKVTGTPLMQEIENAIENEYRDLHPGIYEKVKEDVPQEMLKNAAAINKWFGKSKWYGFAKDSLSTEHHVRLVQDVQCLVKNVVSINPHCNAVGIKFETNMISSIKFQIIGMIHKFEDECKLRFKPEFKYLILVYTLHYFIQLMKPLHEQWEDHNSPIKILLGNEKGYKAEIKTRLEYGFSSASDGYVKARSLIEAVKQKAVKAGYKAKVDSILDHGWMTNSEKVRLQYFEELALEVKATKLENAINHFKDPKQSIEKWFTQKIESMHSKDKIKGKYEKTLKKELEYILDEIQISSNFEDLKHLLSEYAVPENVDDDERENAEQSENYYVTFRDSVKSKIEEFSHTKFDHDSVKYPSASTDDAVMYRLGCTESCPWCGALCWGSRGHHDDAGEIRKHHSCHQPNGLIQVCMNSEDGLRFLDPRACQDIPDDEEVFSVPHIILGRKWGEVKTECFENWKFDSHAIQKFDEMMHWFFQELQKQMSKTGGIKPVPKDWLKKCKCHKLKLEDILVAVRIVKN